MAKKKPTEQQLENLRKGFEALKAKRMKAAEVEDTPPPEPEPEPVRPPPPEPVPPPPPEPAVAKPKIQRQRAAKFDPEAFKATLLAELRQPTPSVTERVVEKPIEKIVVKERLLTGSEILNKLFNF